MDIAHRIIKQEELRNPHQKKLTELQKGQVACTYLKMNSSPKDYQFYKRFIDNEGDIQIPGIDPVTGKKIDTQKNAEKQKQEQEKTLIKLENIKMTDHSETKRTMPEEDSIERTQTLGQQPELFKHSSSISPRDISPKLRGATTPSLNMKALALSKQTSSMMKKQNLQM